MFDFTISLGWGAWAVLIIGALIIGVVAQMFGRAEFGYEWIITAVGAFLGGLVASEFLVDLRAMEPVWDGLALIPAVAGALVVGIVVAVVTRFVTGGRYTEPTAA